jgi:hypothetical protein
MRNDARPIGEEAGRQSPVPSHTAWRQRPSHDPRDRVTRDQQPDVINQDAEEDVRRKDAGTDPTMPASDSNLKIRI